MAKKNGEKIITNKGGLVYMKDILEKALTDSY